MAAKQFDTSLFDRKHLQGLSKSQKTLKALYDKFYKEAAKIGASTGFSDPKKEFYLKDFPKAQKAMEDVVHKLCDGITGVIERGNNVAWDCSDAKNEALVSSLGVNRSLIDKLSQGIRKRSETAKKAFLERKVEGMGLSDRVWQSQKPLRGQLEMALELGLSEGKSAAALSRDVRQYLNNPDKLFRRVRDKDGILRLSKSAEAYHPGRGVYRSSYKNALRMTATENNMAYRSADHAQWGGMDFVVGQEIHLSKNHPVVDICDELQGEYPKDFKFTGWHPFCRCFATPKLADREEMNKWARMSDAERANYEFEGTVKELPKNFSDWVADNAERIASAKSVPYFIKDNYVDGKVGSGFKRIESPSERSGMFGRNHKKYEEVVPELPNIDDIAIFEMQGQRENTDNFLRKLGYSDKAIKSIRPMPFEEADQGKANRANDIYNCQLCAPTLLARMRGVDISSITYQQGGFMERLSKDMRLAFENSEELKPLNFKAEKMSVEKAQEKLKRAIVNLPNNSIHHFGYDSCADGSEGHIWTVIKSNNKTYIVDGQEKRGINHSIDDIIPRIDFADKVEILRVDNLGFSNEFMDFYAKLKKRK